MKMISILLMSLLLVSPAFSSIKKEETSGKYDPIKLRIISGIIASVQKNETIDMETRSALGAILSNLNSKNVKTSHIRSIVEKVRSTLIDKTNMNISYHKINIIKLSDISTALKDRISYLNEKLSTINMRKGHTVELDIKNLVNSIKFVSGFNTQRSLSDPKRGDVNNLIGSISNPAPEIRKQKFTNISTLRTHLINRINLLKTTAEKAQISQLALQDSVNKQSMLVQTVTNALKKIQETKSKLIRNKK